nr:hypothetical protein Iba_chr08bCG7300 [Ipomoea batatas]
MNLLCHSLGTEDCGTPATPSADPIKNRLRECQSRTRRDKGPGGSNLPATARLRPHPRPTSPEVPAPPAAMSPHRRARAPNFTNRLRQQMRPNLGPARPEIGQLLSASPGVLSSSLGLQDASVFVVLAVLLQSKQRPEAEASHNPCSKLSANDIALPFHFLPHRTLSANMFKFSGVHRLKAERVGERRETSHIFHLGGVTGWRRALKKLHPPTLLLESSIINMLKPLKRDGEVVLESDECRCRLLPLHHN